MKKAIVGLVAFGLPLAAMAANGEREFEHSQVGINASSIRSELAIERETRRISFESHGRESVAGSTTARLASAPVHAAAAAGTPSAIAAPEIDPTSAVTGLTLLLGGIAVLRGRKARAV